MAGRGRRIAGRGGHRGQHRGGHRGGHHGGNRGGHREGLRGRSRGGRRGSHHAHGRGRARHHEGARGRWPRGPGGRRSRGNLRLRASARRGGTHKARRTAKSEEARDDMNFVDEADKLPTAIADAIDEGSGSSSDEYVEGPPLEAEEKKKKKEEEARKQKEAEVLREQEEKARQLKEAQEQEEKRREEARKKEEEEKRRNELDAKKRDDDETRRRRKDERKEDEESRWRWEEEKKEERREVRRRRDRLRDEEEYARQRFEERRRDKERRIRRLNEERRWLEEENSLRQLEQESELLEEQEAAAKEEMSVSEKDEVLSPMTKHIVEVVSKLDKCRTKTERPATVEASTETGNDLFYRRPEQGPMRNEETQAGPVKEPVASYLIKRPRSETRLERLLSFFGLASPEQPEQEVIEYNFFDPAALSSRYDDKQHKPVRDGGPYQERKSGKKAVSQEEKKESPENNDPEEKPDKLDAKAREDDTSKQRKKRRGDKKSSKSAPHRDAQKDRAPASAKTAQIRADQANIRKVRTTEGTGAAQRVRGVGYIEEINEEVMEPQRDDYGQTVGPWLRKTRVVRPLETLSVGTLPRQAGAQRKNRPQPIIDELWTRSCIRPSAEQAPAEWMKETGLQETFTAQSLYPTYVGGGAYVPQTVAVPPVQFQPSLMSHTQGPWDIHRPFTAGHDYYVTAEHAPYGQAQYAPLRGPLEQAVFEHSPRQCTHIKFPSTTVPNSVCTCVVKCGDHCVGLGQRRGGFIEPLEPSLRSSSSAHEHESAARFEDTTRIHSEPNLEDERHTREDIKARIRAEEEVRVLTRKLRVLEAGRYEGKSRFDELHEEEEAIRLERERLQGELDRLKELWLENEWRQRHDQGLTQLSRIEERLQLLEQGRNISKKGTPWTRAVLTAMVPLMMSIPSAFPQYGLPAQQVPNCNTPWRSRHRGHRARHCSDAGSGSSDSSEAATAVFPGGREAVIKTKECSTWNSKTFFDDTKKCTNSAKQDQQQCAQNVAFLGRLVPLSSSSYFADKPTGENVSRKQAPSETTLDLIEDITKTGFEPTFIIERADENIGDNAARKQGKANEYNTLAFDNKPLNTIPPEAEVPEIFGKNREPMLLRGTHHKTPLPSHKAVSIEISSLLSGLSESNHDSPTLMKPKVKPRKGHKQAPTEHCTDNMSNSLSDSSSVSMVHLSKNSREFDRTVSSSPKSKQCLSWSSARSRLAVVTMLTSTQEESVSETPSEAPVPSIAPRKLKPVAPRKPPDELSFSEIENEEPYPTEHFLNQMKGESAEKLRDHASSRTVELDSLRPDDLVEEILQSKSADSYNASPLKAPKPPPVAVRSKMLKGRTETASENGNNGAVESLESSIEKPLPLPETVPDYCENYQQSAQSVLQGKTKLPGMTSTRKNSAPSSDVSTAATHNGNVLVCNVLMSCTDEVAAEKEMFEIMETSRYLIPERSFVSFVSLVAILWLTIVLSTTTYLSPKIKADGPTGTTAVTKSSASSYSPHRTSVSSTTHVPSFYLCDSDYCAKEGNFLKSLLSEADYPCEDFYEHICQRWTQSHSSEATGGETISEDVFLEDRMERILLSSFKNNAAALKPAVKFIRICKNSASSASVHEVRQVFKHWRIREWPVPSYELRHREDAWVFAGELLRDMGLPVLADVSVAVHPFNARIGVTTLKPPEPLHFAQDTVPDLVDRAVKETLRSFNINDPSLIERLADEIMAIFDVIEHLAEDKDNSTMLNDCELDHDVFNLLSTAVAYSSNRRESITCNGTTYIQLLSARYFEKLPEELRGLAVNALLNHLGFRALVRLAAFMPISLRALRELSYLEVTGRSEVPDIESLCLRAMEGILPLCLVKAAALPLIQNGAALWQRRWLSDLEFTFLQALPQVPWLDERALFALTFRLQRIRVDSPFSIDEVRENAQCLPVGLKVGNRLTDILALFREIRTRRTIIELRSGPGWRPLSPLKMWPYFDASLRRIRIPQGLLNNSVPANSSIFAFHLSRVAIRYYAAMVPLLYTSFEYDREATTDLGHESKRLFEVVQHCLEEDWRTLSELEAAGLPIQYGLLDHRAWWLRRWLLGQTLAVELALHAFRELTNVHPTWKPRYRFVTLPDYTSTQLFFLYYALDHCEMDYEGFERRQFLQRKRPPPKMRVNLPLRHVEAFADAFGCRHGDQMRADQQCTTFLN